MRRAGAEAALLDADDRRDRLLAGWLRGFALGRYVLARTTPCSGCLLWQGARSAAGGYAQMNTRQLGKGLVHHALFRAAFGPWRPTQRLANLCGRNQCLVPEHWAPVAPGEIISASYATGRRGGVLAYRAGLKGYLKRTGARDRSADAQAARAMRAEGRRITDIAAHFGISTTAAKRWLNGRTWRAAGPFAGLGR